MAARKPASTSTSARKKRATAGAKKAGAKKAGAKKAGAKKKAPTKQMADPAHSDDAGGLGPRDAIRHAAFACFAAHGYHETRLEDICREAGISRGAFYWHFESKEAVFLEILEVWTTEVQQEVRRQFEGAFSANVGDPHRALLEALVREGRRGRRVLPLWLDGLVQSRRHPAMQAALAQFLASVRGTMAEVIRPAFAPYHRPEEIDALAGLLFSCFIGAIAQEIAEPDGDLYDRQVQQLMTTTLRFADLVVATGGDDT
jgi:AcrR family transcriptional regulator